MQEKNVSSVKSNLKTYLQRVRHPLSSRVHLILGNEAADVDSMVSAICLAYQWRKQDPPPVPVINIKRNELKLRRDVILALNEANIEASDLTFADEVESILNHPCEGTNITLVDHNEPAAHQKNIIKVVNGIIDHHADNGLLNTVNPRIINKVASCSTLIWELGEEWDKETARLLLCAIMLDSGNLTTSNGKTTLRDIKAVTALLTVASMNRKASVLLHRRLKSARKDIEGMSVYDLLRKDAKVFVGGDLKVVISSLGSSMDELIIRATNVDKKNIEQIMEEYRKERCVDSVIIMGGKDSKGEFRRQIGVLNSSIGESIVIKLRLENVLSIQDIQHDQHMWWMWQGNENASRKIVGPIVQKLLESTAKEIVYPV